MPALTTYAALLRGINVGGKTKIPMKELVKLCESFGWSDVTTLLQTGNVLFRASGSTALESTLEAGIAAQFGLTISVVIRETAILKAHLAQTPFEKASRDDPSHLLLYLSKRPPEPTAIESIRSRATAGELIESQDEAIWIHFPNGIGRSKITPSVMDRAVGSPATGRNWNTFTKLCKRS
jgi:uncharacterized protein (DUF1697 family)